MENSEDKAVEELGGQNRPKRKSIYVNEESNDLSFVEFKQDDVFEGRIDFIKGAMHRLSNAIRVEIDTNDQFAPEDVADSWYVFASSAYSFFDDLFELINGIRGVDTRLKKVRLDHARRTLNESAFDFLATDYIKNYIGSSHNAQSLNHLFGQLYGMIVFLYDDRRVFRSNFLDEAFVGGVLEFAFKVKSGIGKEISSRISDMYSLKSDIDQRYDSLKEISEAVMQVKHGLSKFEEDSKKSIENYADEARSKLGAIYSYNELYAANKFFSDRARQHQDSYVLMITLMAIIVFATCIFAVFSFDPVVAIANNVLTKLPSAMQPAVLIVVVTSFFALIFWTLRLLSKILMQDYTLMNDALQKVAMINSYVALLADGKVNEMHREVVLREIFRNPIGRDPIEEMQVDQSWVGQIVKTAQNFQGKSSP